MEDLPRRYADLLEGIATKVRSLTVDRVHKAITIASLTLPLAVLALLAVIFLFLTLHLALAIPLGDAGAYGVLGGVFVVAGAFAWRKRTAIPKDQP
jgi:hypothetical protein